MSRASSTTKDGESRAGFAPTYRLRRNGDSEAGGPYRPTLGAGGFRRLVEAVQRKAVRVGMVWTPCSWPPMVADGLRRIFIELLESIAPVSDNLTVKLPAVAA